MYSIKTAPTEPLDEQWYQRLKPLLLELGETFVALMPSDEKLRHARDAFVASGYRSSPELFTDTPSTDKLLSIRGRLVNLRQDLQAHESVREVRELYDERIEELIANVDMISAASVGDKGEFLRQNKLIYGLPDYDIFAASCNWIRQEVGKANPNVSDELRAQVLQAVPDIDGDVSLLLPNDDTFNAVKDFHFQPGGYIDQLFADAQIPDDTVITAAIGDPITRQVIRNIGSDFALVDSPSGLWSVLQSQHQVTRPGNLALDKQAFMGIVAHEVGSHLLESTNGATSNLKLMELGLDRYECGNEGRAFLREQIMYDHISDYIDQPHWRPTKASWEYRVAIHMVISLAVGLTGREYDFAELYRLLTVLFRFWTANRGEPVDENVIHDGAWSMAIRALKGTDGRGGAYLKDIVYLEGNIRCWRAAQQTPEIILSGDKGKFDIANPAHVARLQTLQILPAE